MLYPIAEIFESPQGEGFHAGKLMTFIRLAGCSVGKPFPSNENEVRARINSQTPKLTPFPILQPYQNQCTAWDGKKFDCDTDYGVKTKMTEEEIVVMLKKGNARAICLTGGEPLIHNIVPLIVACRLADIDVHIETSGTKDIATVIDQTNETLYNHEAYTDGHTSFTFVAVSPKAGYTHGSLQAANEIKVLVDRHSFNLDHFKEVFGLYWYKTFLQPINGEHSLDMENVNFVLGIQKQLKWPKLSLQMHKLIGVQ